MTQDNMNEALSRLRGGRMIIVVDDTDRENEGDLVMAAQFASTDSLAFIVRHTTGIICAPMNDARADELGLRPMVENNGDPHATAFTVSVDSVHSGTGVSASDRAITLRALACAETPISDLRTPGHIFPLRARHGGVRERRGHTEACVDLLRLAGLTDVGIIGELIGKDGSMMRGRELLQFAHAHDLPIVSIEELTQVVPEITPIDFRRVEMRGSASLPTPYGEFRAHAYGAAGSNIEHLVLSMGGNVERVAPRPTLVRVHSECITGDLAASLKCDCGYQFRKSLELIAEDGAGVLIYLRGQEGRGIGLGHKLQAYALQERGRDTVDANTELGLPVDNRDYSVAADVLLDLGIQRIRLITNNPDKRSALAARGIDVVDRVPIDSQPTTENIEYLLTKRDRMGHLLDL